MVPSSLGSVAIPPLELFLEYCIIAVPVVCYLRFRSHFGAAHIPVSKRPGQAFACLIGLIDILLAGLGADNVTAVLGPGAVFNLAFFLKFKGF